MRIIFFGLGSAGQRHARLIHQHFPEHRLYAYRTHKGNSLVHEDLQDTVTGLHTWDEILHVQPHCAFICNPPQFHIDTAIKCAERDMALFIEKPLGNNTEGLDKLLDAVEERGLVSYVAYNLRHNPIVVQLKADLSDKKVYCANLTDTSYLPAWKENHKDTYLAHIGACLDLSHNIDLAVDLFGPVEKITGSVDRLSDVTIDADDCVNMVVRHESGVVSNIHIDTFSELNDWRCVTGVIDEEPYNFCRVLSETFEGRPIHDQDATQQSYINQLQYFFDNLSNPQMDNCLHDAAVLFGQLMAFKARCER